MVTGAGRASTGESVGAGLLSLAGTAVLSAVLMSAVFLAPGAMAQGSPTTAASAPVAMAAATSSPTVNTAPAAGAGPVSPSPSLAASASAGSTGATTSLLSPSWASLTPSQKECLAPLAPEWDRLDSALKGKWLEIAARYPKLSPEHQQRLRERMVAWTRMSPAERQKARIGYQHAGDLRSEEQASRLQAKWEAYQALSPETRQRLAERAAEKASERVSERRAGKDTADAMAVKHLPGSPTSSGAAALQQAPLTLTSSGPTVVLARPGTTTILLTRRADAPMPAVRTLGGAARPLRSPRDGHLNPQTLLPERDAARRADDTSR
ncbi:DUF3106 domain-containing protein [Roseateles sp. SL47]|uniref:DUF3106 domain-containing protein n=1 Tax=Roseateles sp. SL47 TaxID=2995138 RepID=UPI00226F6E3B|nr:DUF3106 domain-containing protein [Roseateles sp. SL47]WAC72812.1 DUF3106 domain-containing protein [Roseateles sp. SL47]